MGVCQSRVLLPCSITTVWNMLITPEQMPLQICFLRLKVSLGIVKKQNKFSTHLLTGPLTSLVTIW
jgi:hypothetical protein